MLPEDSKKFIANLERLWSARLDHFATEPDPTGKEKELVKIAEEMTLLIGIRYTFLSSRRAGEAILFELEDIAEKNKYALKIAQPGYNMLGLRGASVRSQKLNDFSISQLSNPYGRRFARGAGVQEVLSMCIPREIGIVPRVDSDNINTHPLYFLMEWIDGKKLIWFSQNKSLTASLSFFVRFLGLVESVHQQEVVHGDIKPANILVVEDKNGNTTPALLDFSLSKNLKKPGENVTTVGFPMQSPGYGSPLMQKDSARRSFFDDVYMCGRTLLAVVLKRDVSDKDRTPDGIETELKAIIDRATHPDPRSRYRSIKAFSDDLANYVMSSEHRDQKSEEDVLFDDTELSETELEIVRLLHAGMVKIANEERL